MTTMIHHLVRAGFRVPDLAASVAHASELLGLNVREQTPDEVSLALPGQQPCLILRTHGSASFDFMALHTTSDNLAEIRRRLDAHGVTYTDGFELEEPTIRFHAPNGVAVEVGVGEPHVRNESPRESGPVIGALDHLSFAARDQEAFKNFFIDVLDFRLTDSVLGERHWLRCNENHHTVAVFNGEDGLHHYAFETSDLNGLGALGDLLAARGQNFMWGPGRHALGMNIFTYHLDPAGSILEVCSNMLQIGEEEEWEAEVWTNGLKSAVLWGPLPPTGFREVFIPPLQESEIAR